MLHYPRTNWTMSWNCFIQKIPGEKKPANYVTFLNYEWKLIFTFQLIFILFVEGINVALCCLIINKVTRNRNAIKCTSNATIYWFKWYSITEILLDFNIKTKLYLNNNHQHTNNSNNCHYLYLFYSFGVLLCWTHIQNLKS